MNELTIFENEQFGKVRTIAIDGEPWFVAVDVCRALEISNSRMATDRLDIDEKAAVSLTDVSSNGIEQKRNMVIINEPGLYTLVLGSRKKEAKEFKRWITHEVIPSIRKHGAYMTGETIEAVLRDPQEMAKLLLELANERNKNKQLEEDNLTKDKQIVEMKPKATYYDMVLQSDSLLSATEIAKDFRMTAQELNKFLEDHDVQFKRNGVWTLYKKYAQKGYAQTKTYVYNGYSTSLHTYWTQSGRLFIYDLLKQNNILPTVEIA